MKDLALRYKIYIPFTLYYIAWLIGKAGIDRLTVVGSFITIGFGLYYAHQILREFRITKEKGYAFLVWLAVISGWLIIVSRILYYLYILPSMGYPSPF